MLEDPDRPSPHLSGSPFTLKSQLPYFFSPAHMWANQYEQDNNPRSHIFLIVCTSAAEGHIQRELVEIGRILQQEMS